ncbi:hypothetical protein GEMRC1_008977 [Eukaryota sp. GEM-RC1]
MNDRSSRSHSIFRIILESSDNFEDSDGAVRISYLNLVDLAGSERACQTGANGTQLREASNINKSLLTLGLVINQLQSNSNVHISYRDYILTHVLMNALGGNCLTAMICCITPAFHHFEVSRTTLEFATRTKNVKNKAKINEVLDEKALLRKYEKEIKQLKEKNLEKDNLLDDLKVQLDILKQHASEGGNHLLDCQSKEQEIATTTSKLSAEVHF